MMNSLKILILLTIFLSFTACKEYEWNNVLDDDVSTDLWKPIKLSKVDSTPHSLTLTWKLSEEISNSGNIERFWIDRKRGNVWQNNFKTVEFASATKDTCFEWTDTNIIPDSSFSVYKYRISSSSGIKHSANSDSTELYIAKFKPESLTLELIENNTKLNINWTSSAGGIDGFKIYKKTNGLSWVPYHDTKQASVTNFVDTTIFVGYVTYRIFAYIGSVKSEYIDATIIIPE